MLNMRIDRNGIFVLILSVTVISCKTADSVSMEELKSFVLEPGHGLNQSVTRNEIRLEVTYRPKDLVIVQDVGTENKTKWVETKAQLDSLDYFVLKISRQGEEVQNTLAGDQVKFNSAISYLSSGIENDIFMTMEEGEVVRMESSSFVPTFGISNGTTVLLVFKSYLDKRARDFSIIFRDSMFGTGSSEFRFAGSDITNVPSLQTQF
jgi:hypothetical protein